MSNLISHTALALSIIVRPSQKMRQFIVPYQIIQKDARLKYPPYLQTLYDQIFSLQPNQTESDQALNIQKMKQNLQISFVDLLAFQRVQTQTPICNKSTKKMRENSRYYFKCYDCTKIDGCMYCEECFLNSQHIGHAYQRILLGQGFCDCGNNDIIKESGFCKNHKGYEKCSDVQAQKEDYEKFTLMLQILFTWFQQVQNWNSSMGVCFAKFFASQFIAQICWKNLYYCKLFSWAIFQQFSLDQLSKSDLRMNEQRESTTIFKIMMSHYKNLKIAEYFEQALMQTFSVKQTKVAMLVELIKACNNIQGFQSGGYKSMLIQLLVSSEILLKVVQEKQLVLIQKQKMNQAQFLMVINFIRNLPQKVSSVYFCMFLSKQKFLKVRFLYQIEKNIQTQNKHIVQAIELYMQNQNEYVIAVLDITRIILSVSKQQGNQQKVQQKIDSINSEKITKGSQDTIIKCQTVDYLIALMLTEYFNILKSKIHSYRKNRIFLTNHRLLAFSIFTYFGFRLQNISAKKLVELLKIRQNQLFVTIVTTSIQILFCVWEFSIYCSKTTYFSNYTPLYINGGKMLFLYDSLFLRIAVLLLKQLKHPFSQIIGQFIRKKYSEIQTILQPHSKKVQLKQFYSILNSFLSLITEIVVSVKQQVIIAQQLGFEYIQKEQTQFYVDAFLSFKEEFTDDQFKQFSRFFLGRKFNSNQIRNLAEYNPKTKKFRPINKSLNEPFDFRFHASLAKVHYFPSYFIDQQRSLRQPKLFKICQTIRDQIFDLPFCTLLLQMNQRLAKDIPLCQLTEKLTLQLSKILLLNISNKTAEGLIKNFLSKQFIHNSKKYQADTFISAKQIVGIKPQNDQQKTQEIQLQNNKRKAMIEKIKNSKIQQMKEKQRKAKINFVQQPQKNQQKEERLGFQNAECLLCKQKNQEKVMCHIGRFNYSNKIHFLFKIPLHFLGIYGCGHLIHFECLRNHHISNHKFSCPLCKMSANVLIPCQFEFDRCAQSQQPQKLVLLLEIYSIVVLRAKEEYMHNLGNILQRRSDIGRYSSTQNTLVQMCTAFIQILGYKAFRNPLQFFREIELYRSYLGLIKRFFSLNQTIDKQDIVRRLTIKLQQVQKFIKNAFLQQDKMLYPFSQTKQLVLNYIFQLKYENGCLTQYKKKSLNLQTFQKAVQGEKIQNCELNAIRAFVSALIVPEKITISENANRNLKNSSLFTPKDLMCKFFRPPKDIPSLFKLRDQRKTTLQTCPKIHQRYICMLCSIEVCGDCQSQLKKHNINHHADNSFYLNLFNSCISIKVQKIIINLAPIYADFYGDTWQASKGKSSNYKLDQEELDKYMQQMLDYKFEQRAAKLQLDLRRNIFQIFEE